MSGHRYGGEFFDYVDATSGRSAAGVLARLELGFSPGSVLDVGCGRGIWLSEWKRRGVGSVLGLDGDYVDRSRLKVAEGEFRALDLAQPFDLGRRFDVVQCLEVAEHLPGASADGLVASLVRHGDVVLFSAATPGQGGEHHVNEQPLEYWKAKFAEQGYAAFDCVRPAIRGVDGIEPWYRYNTLVYASADGTARLSEKARAAAAGSEGLSDYAPLTWRLRCAVIGALPRATVDWLAALQHRLRS